MLRGWSGAVDARVDELPWFAVVMQGMFAGGNWLVDSGSITAFLTCSLPV